MSNLFPDTHHFFKSLPIKAVLPASFLLLPFVFLIIAAVAKAL